MTALRELAVVLGRHRGRIALGLLFTLIAVASTLLLPWLVGQAVNALSERDEDRLVEVAMIMLGVGSVGALATWLKTLVVGRLSWEAENDLRAQVHDRALEADPGFVRRLGAAQVLTRALVDVRDVGYFFGYGLGAAAGATITALAALAAMLIVHPLLTVAALTPLPFVALATRAYDRRATPALQETLQRVGEVGHEADENIAGALTIRALAREDVRMRRTRTAVERLFDQQLRAIHIKARYQPLISFLVGLTYVAVLAYGTWLAVDHDITAGEFVAFYGYLTVLLVPLNSIPPLFELAQTAAAAAKRVVEVLDHRPTIVDAPGARELPDGPGAVRVTDCDTELLHGIDLDVPGRGTVAVVGPSGSGKTALLGLVRRAHDPARGSVSVDGADVREVTLASLHHALGILREEPFLFAATVRENIAFARPDATEAEVERAARLAAAHEFIVDLPRGYDTQVGERAMTLSGGQRQRIGLARALLAEPRVLILDDPTAGLDPQTEQAVIAALRRVMENTTTIVATRRTELLEAAGEVVVLEAGRIVERGTHEALLASPRYRAVIDAARQRPAPDALAEPAAPAAEPTPEDEADAPDLPRHPHPWRTAAGLLRPHRRLLVGALVVVVITSVLLLLPPYLAGRAVDAVIDPAKRDELTALVAIFAGAALAAALAGALQIYLVERLGARLLANLRVALMERLLALPMAFFDRQQSGRLVSRLTNDVEAMDGALGSGIVTLLSSIVSLLGPLVLMIAIDTDLALLAFATFPVIALAVAFFRRASAAAYARVRVVTASLTVSMHESLAGLSLVQAYNQGERRRRALAAENEANLQAKMRTTRLSAGYLGGVELYVVGSLVFVVLYGGNQVLDREVALGALVSFTLYLQQFLASAQALSTLAPIYSSARAALDHVLSLLAVRSDLVEHPDAQPLPEGPGEVRLRSVGACYDEDRPVLTDVDLAFAPGEVVAVVGRTGAGKSTLARLLPRLYDVSDGAVLVDGMDVREVTIASLRREVGLVPQEGFLFRGTVADNLRLGDPDATDDDLAAAAAAVDLADAGLGLDTEVEERGSNLSSGQRQLVALARTLVGNPRVVVFDEATSRIDSGRQARVEEAIARQLGDCTVVVVAHHLSTMQRADRVIVLDRGRVVPDPAEQPAAPRPVGD